MTIKKFISFLLLSLSALFFISLFIPLETNDFRKESIHSLKVLDRNGKILREFLNDEQGRGEWIAVEKISHHVVDATIAAEDKRFYSHYGVDPIAMTRAVYENLFLSARSGGSSITQQVIRTVYHHPRTFGNKITEAWYALRLERMMEKEEILEQYFNRAPYGNQLNGIQAAAKYYFDKPASELSIAEAAFLAGLPNAPTFLNPHKNHAAAMMRQKKILRLLLAHEKITQQEYERAIVQPIPVVSPETKFKAPHAVELVYAQVMKRENDNVVILSEAKNLPEAWEPLQSPAHRPDSSLRPGKNVGTTFRMTSISRPVQITTTLDIELQTDLQWVVKGHLEQLKKKHVSNAALIVIHNQTGEIRTLIGSADYFNQSISGNVNGVLALRQPGSAMKPFTYAVALESGFTPSTLLADVPTSLPAEGGDYVPENYDREYHGPVRLRTALACSYNIPAVRVLHSIGKDALFGRLQQVGITTLDRSPKHYGYGLTLGNAEVTLLELTNAYRTFANNGVWDPVKIVKEESGIAGEDLTEPIPLESGERCKVISDEAAYLITDILKDPVARRPAFGNHFRFSFPCAVKTGTTKDYKDNWTIGYTPEYTVGVWTGNFDSKPMLQVSGVTGAGQIFTDVMNLIMTKYSSVVNDFVRPKNITTRTICARSGKLPTAHCEKTIQELFIAKKIPTERCDIHKKYFVRRSDGSLQDKVFEIFSPEYKEWAELENLPRPPATAIESDARSSNRLTANRPVIVFPHDGDVFKVDPVLRREYQKIKIDALLPHTISDAQLVINGNERVAYNREGTWWQLRKGEHHLQLSAFSQKGKISSAKIKIFVE
ncbi:MAG: transglycosylase domain-containing protein [Ignavibacteriales bacterium]|nr:transglycosylase domain-containing protein [Ignavibacteriales bacterium]